MHPKCPCVNFPCSRNVLDSSPTGSQQPVIHLHSTTAFQHRYLRPALRSKTYTTHPSIHPLIHTYIHTHIPHHRTRPPKSQKRSPETPSQRPLNPSKTAPSFSPRKSNRNINTVISEESSTLAGLCLDGLYAMKH